MLLPPFFVLNTTEVINTTWAILKTFIQSGSMMAELHRIVSEELPKFDGKAVVLTGQPSGGAFCAGSDVNCLVEFSSPQDGLKAQFNMFSL